MNTPPDPTQAATPGPSTPTKKPYVAPAIISREPLEVFAGLCTPAPPGKGNIGSCPDGVLSS